MVDALFPLALNLHALINILNLLSTYCRGTRTLGIAVIWKKNFVKNAYNYREEYVKVSTVKMN